MSRIFRDSSVLNQFGSPSINSNTFANRPAFGQVGRLFVDTTNNIIQRDTGSSWVTISGAGSTPSLQAVTGVGNTSSNGIFLGNSGSLTAGLQFQVSGYSQFAQIVGSASDLGSNVNQLFELQTSGTTIATGSPSAGFSRFTLNNLAAQTIGGAGNAQIGAGLFENVITDLGTGSYPFTVTQTVGISALSPIISYGRYTGTFGSAISHYAGLVINGLQATAGSALAITNNYQLLINSSQQFTGSTTVTNRLGIYQLGANDLNYFAGNLLVNTTTNANGVIQANGSIVINNFDSFDPPLAAGVKIGYDSINKMGIITSGKLATYGAGLTLSGNLLIFKNSNSGNEMSRFDASDNFLIGTTTNANNVKLKVNGIQGWSNITYGTGVHTTSGNHLPIYVNGTQYWLALLNPPVAP